MARPRKPTKLLLLNGSTKRNPGRLKGRAVKAADGTWQETVESQPLDPTPPAYFDAAERERWEELLRLVPPGILGAQDLPVVEMICQLWARLRRRELDHKQQSLLATLLGRCGMTPAERSKVGVPDRGKTAGANPFASLG